MKTLRYSPIDSDYEHLVIIDKITRLSKSSDGEITNIHLINGEIIQSDDSINGIEARINMAEKL